MLIMAVIFLTFLVVCRITPFGNSTWLVFDMKRQYADFYSYYQTIISGENNIFYSPAMTLGSGAVGFYTYYLSSPFLLITALFDAAHVSIAITIMIGIKLVIAAGSCDLFLKHYIEGAKSKTLIFALTYPLCAYMISNSVNPMWLDVFMMMPIVIWMLDRLIDKNARTGYILSLAYIIWCNYYIAFMVCLFIIMWTFYRLILKKEDFVKKLFNVAICSFWAVALDALILLPTVIELSGSPKDIFQLGLQANKGNRGLKEIISKLWFLAYNSEQTLYGSPLIYMGIVMVVLTILYYTNKKIDKKEKISMAVMMVIFVISFMLDKVNLVWHGGMEPSGYPYREAFMFTFLCIICSCKNFNLYKEGIELKYLLLTTVIAIGMLVFSLTGNYQYVDKRMIICNVILLLVILALLFVYTFVVGKGRVRQNLVTRQVERAVLLALVVVQLTELFVNGVYVYKNQTVIGMTWASDFKDTVYATSELVEYAKQYDNSFYRMENMAPREQNDGMMYDFNGVTHYSSAGTIYTRFFLKELGFNDDRLYTHFGHDNTCTADSVLGIKYLINTNGNRNDYTKIYGGDNGLVENPFAMSVAWVVPEKPELEYKDAFSIQEKLFEDILGKDVTIFESVIDSEEEDQNDQGIYRLYNCVCETDGYVYFYIEGIDDINQNIVIYRNDELLCGYGNLGCMKVLNLGYYKAGDSFRIYVKCDNAEARLGETHIVTENMNKLAAVYDEAKTSNAVVSSISSSKYTISIPETGELKGAGETTAIQENGEMKDSGVAATDAEAGEMKGAGDVISETGELKGADDVISETGVMKGAGVVTTIPYSKGWKVKVDGSHVEPEKVYDTFMYIPVTDGHLIEITYEPEGMLEGAIISLIAIIGIILLAVLDKRKDM